MLAASRRRRSPTRNSGAERLQHLLRHHAAVGLVLQVADHDRELVRAGARQRVRLAHAAARRWATSRSTASAAMAERVVHLPEVVEAHQQRGHHPVAALRQPDRLAQAVVEQAPVRQPGELSWESRKRAACSARRSSVTSATSSTVPPPGAPHRAPQPAAVAGLKFSVRRTLGGGVERA